MSKIKLHPSASIIDDDDDVIVDLPSQDEVADTPPTPALDARACNGNVKTITFKVDEEYHSDLKKWCVEHKMTIKEVLQEGWQLLKDQRGH